ncbi:hypothetical protein, partial [Legionella shakespearei]|uniref:hypothetical protein n=1 Tax=Legionella shakespearei TaxID=45075 RepID=UPI001ED9B604
HSELRSLDPADKPRYGGVALNLMATAPGITLAKFPYYASLIQATNLYHISQIKHNTISVRMIQPQTTIHIVPA